MVTFPEAHSHDFTVLPTEQKAVTLEMKEGRVGYIR